MRICLFLSICITAYCSNDGDLLKCKPKPGCSMVQCQPKPGRRPLNAVESDGYPIVCQKNEPSRSDASASARSPGGIETELFELRQRLEKYEKEGDQTKLEIRNLKSQIKKERTESKEILKSTMDLLCPIRYRSKCFYPAIGRKVNYYEGAASCGYLGGHLANIYSQAHMDAVMKYIREHRWEEGARSMYFRLGMVFNPMASKLRLHDGSDAPHGMKWSKNFPSTGERTADRTSVLLAVSKDPSTEHQYIYNFEPTHDRYYICETM